MDHVRSSISVFRKKPFFKHGIPFFIIVFGSALALKQFTSLRYEFSRKENMSKEEKEELENLFLPSSEYNIETEYEKIKKLDINKWENKRISRPWEE